MRTENNKCDRWKAYGNLTNLEDLMQTNQTSSIGKDKKQQNLIGRSCKHLKIW